MINIATVFSGIGSIEFALKRMGIDEKSRGETLSLEQFSELSVILQTSGAMLN